MLTCDQEVLQLSEQNYAADHRVKFLESKLEVYIDVGIDPVVLSACYISLSTNQSHYSRSGR